MKKILLLLLAFILLAASVMGANIGVDDFECDGFNCGTGWNGAWAYSGTCEITTTSNPIDTYNMRGTKSCDATRNLDTTGYGEVNVTFYATAGSLEGAEECRYYYYDGSSYHLLLTLVNGDDDNSHDYYNFNVTDYGLSTTAGVRMATSFSSSGDYCYLDNVTVVGETGAAVLEIFMDDQYLTGAEDVVIELSSSLPSTLHTFQLKNETGGIFCNENLTSPAVAYTSFSTTCDMPDSVQTNATAILYVTSDDSQNTTHIFNVTQAQQDSTKLDISKVYYSPFVLQGSNIEIYSVLKLGSNVSIDRITTTVTFPDSTTRIFGMEETVNTNEFKSFISDTYQTGTIYFTIRVESGTYFDVYTNQYTVVPFSIDYVENVGSVDMINQPIIEMHGTEYFSDEPVKVWLQLLNASLKTIDDAVCYLWVYTPANTLFITRANMFFVDRGIYSYDFDAPFIGGVYPAISRCFFTAEQEFHYASGFTPHVYASVTGNYSDTYTLDIVDHTIKETNVGGTKRVSIEYNFSHVCNDSDPDLLTGFSLGMNIKWQSATDDYLYIYWWNWTDSSWNIFPNTVNYNTDRLYVTNSKETNNLSRDGYTDEYGNFRIMINDTANTDAGSSFIYMDHLYVTCDELSDPEWHETKGSSEVHITLDESSVTGFFLDELTVAFIDDTGYEGNIEINFTVYSRVLEPTDIIHSYNLPLFMTCEDIEYFSMLLDNGTWVSYPYEYNSTAFSCEMDIAENIIYIEWLRSVDLNDVHMYSLTLNNRLKRILRKYSANVNTFYSDISTMCTNYFNANGYSIPSIPLLYEPENNDTFADGCAHFWNTYHYFNLSLYECFLLEGQINTSQSFDLFEEHINRMFQFHEIMMDDFIIGSGLSGIYSAYSEQDGQGTTAYKFWSNYSTNYIIDKFLKQNMSKYVWTFDNRTITAAQDTFVGQTEYDINEEVGKIVVRMTDVTGDPVADGNCTLRVYYPNSTVYINHSIMTEINSTDYQGIYYYDFNLSDTLGIYSYAVDCQKLGKDYYLMNTFHVRNISQEIWESNVRTLTNATNIAPDIWGTNSTIHPGLLLQIVGDVWDYVSRYTHGIIN